jgi:hypothetical protein
MGLLQLPMQLHADVQELDDIIKEYLERYRERLDMCPEILQAELDALRGDHMLGQVLHHPELAQADATLFQEFVATHHLTPEQQQVSRPSLHSKRAW